MKYLSEEIYNKIVSAVEEKFETVISENIDRFIDFFNSLTDLREAFPDYDENQMILNTKNARKVCDDIITIIDKHYQRNESLNFEILFPGLLDELENSLLQLEPIVKVEQSDKRFRPLTDDKKIIQLAKRFKSVVYKSHQLILRIINFVLIKINKKPFELKYWNQKIPLRNVGFYYLRNKLLKRLSLAYEDIIKMLNAKSIEFWNYDEKYDLEYILNFVKGHSKELVNESTKNPETIIAELESLKNEIKKEVINSIQKCNDEFYYTCKRVGTIEINKLKFNKRRIDKHLNTIQNEFNRVIKEWDNTLYALGEDWELNYDLQSTRYSAIEVFFQFEKSLFVKNKIQIYPQFTEISSAFNFISEKLNQFTPDLQGFERLVAHSKENLQKVLLSSVIPNLINSLSDLKLQGMVNEARRAIKNQLRTLVEKRAFVKTASYDRKIKSSEIDEIYPREFISFNTLPKLLASLEKIKENVSVELKNIQSELINLGNMADFSLESAISAAIKENLSLSDTKGVALDGIKVSQDKQEQLLNSFKSLCENVLEDLRSSVSGYCEELNSLTQSSKIIEIRVQLAKAKAKAKVKETKDRLFSNFKNVIPFLFEKIKIYFKKGFGLYHDTRKQFGLTESVESIASEISDFLSSTNSPLEKLPYIYRRLFQISPLENDRLYISREFEENQLQKAHTNWLDGGFAPVIISGEKGGGITSFLNITLKKLEDENNIKRVSIKPSVCNQKDLLLIFGEMFSPEKFLGIEALITYLKNEENRQIVVIENLQHLYLRSVKGFDCLKTLTDMISKTSKNIFWITTCTLYANDFLNKTIRLNDIFGYHIPLKQLQSNQIIELIKKRNSISGYNLEYQVDDGVARKKDFEKLTYEQKQSLLEKDFFNSLNKFAQSNISLALLFWIRSIKEIQERKVCINSNLEISKTLLDSLSPEKIFVLQSLILHDGLRFPDLAKTINHSLAETNQLTQILYDDGVLVKNDEVFLINPLLYRQSVTLLKSKNLL